MFSDLLNESTGLEDILGFNEDLTMYLPATLDSMKTSTEYTHGLDLHDLHQYQQERPKSTSSTVSSPLTDMADLEDVDDTWRNDPDWVPETRPTRHTFTSTRSVTQHSNTRPELTKKRPRKSTTSDLEIEIEMEANQKRVKRCTKPLTEEQKRLRRKELNRIAAQRCRNKRSGRAEILEQEVEILTKKNAELKETLDSLTETKDQLYDIIKYHFESCHTAAKPDFSSLI